MGVLMSSNPKDMDSKPSKQPNRTELFEVTSDNGYIFSKKYCIPEELLSIILSYVEPKDLVFNCRRVCKTWCNVIDTQVWRLKFQRHNYHVQKVQELPWFACYWILVKNPLNRNLVKNGCGQENFKHWKVFLNGGHQWLVEKPPVGCENFPEDADEEVQRHNSCFVTSFHDCAKEQIIDLAAEGAAPEFMDVIKPDIVVSEWYAGRFDCLSIYKLNVVLLDKNKNPVHDSQPSISEPVDVTEDILRGQFQTGSIRVGSGDGSSWHKVTHVFNNYDSGVRYVRFQHCGKDAQFWAGHYGSKMTGASVILTLPRHYQHDNVQNS